jgi:hypothetical protein
VSGISLLDSSNASVWPSLPPPTAVIASGPEDVGSSSSSHERGGEWPLLRDPRLLGRWASISAELEIGHIFNT